MVSELAGYLRGTGVRQSQTVQQILVAKDAKELLKRSSLLRSGTWMRRVWDEVDRWWGSHWVGCVSVDSKLRHKLGQTSPCHQRLVQVSPTLVLTEITSPEERVCYSITFARNCMPKYWEFMGIAPSDYPFRTT
jgi:hypothetical protein